ncbi:hypothetical protein M3Y99_01868800 [Aphelenchoides fujianensis]|nr:hypothetical protein M3Y99_01868800 [Aphelenchoides fujianensis]
MKIRFSAILFIFVAFFPLLSTSACFNQSTINSTDDSNAVQEFKRYFVSAIKRHRDSNRDFAHEQWNVLVMHNEERKFLYKDVYYDFVAPLEESTCNATEPRTECRLTWKEVTGIADHVPLFDSLRFFNDERPKVVRWTCPPSAQCCGIECCGMDPAMKRLWIAAWILFLVIVLGIAAAFFLSRKPRDPNATDPFPTSALDLALGAARPTAADLERDRQRRFPIFLQSWTRRTRQQPATSVRATQTTAVQCDPPSPEANQPPPPYDQTESPLLPPSYSLCQAK